MTRTSTAPAISSRAHSHARRWSRPGRGPRLPLAVPELPPRLAYGPAVLVRSAVGRVAHGGEQVGAVAAIADHSPGRPFPPGLSPARGGLRKYPRGHRPWRRSAAPGGFRLVGVGAPERRAAAAEGGWRGAARQRSNPDNCGGSAAWNATGTRSAVSPASPDRATAGAEGGELDGAVALPVAATRAAQLLHRDVLGELSP